MIPTRITCSDVTSRNGDGDPRFPEGVPDTKLLNATFPSDWSSKSLEFLALRMFAHLPFFVEESFARFKKIFKARRYEKVAILHIQGP